MLDAKNTLLKGALSLSRAIYEYQKLGYIVSLPLVDAQDYDLIIEKNNKFYSVQCKFTRSLSRSKNFYCVGLRSIATNTKITKSKHRGVYDFLFVLCGNETCYSIPSDILGKTLVFLGPKYNKYKL